MANKYVLLDISRNMYWKYNDFGYTRILDLAKKFTMEEALKKANATNVTNLKIIEMEKAEKFIEGYEIELI